MAKRRAASPQVTAARRYWRAVKAIQRSTGASTREARGAYKSLKANRSIATDRAVRQHPIIVARAVREVAKQRAPVTAPKRKAPKRRQPERDQPERPKLPKSRAEREPARAPRKAPSRRRVSLDEWDPDDYYDEPITEIEGAADYPKKGRRK